MMDLCGLKRRVVQIVVYTCINLDWVCFALLLYAHYIIFGEYQCGIGLDYGTLINYNHTDYLLYICMLCDIYVFLVEFSKSVIPSFKVQFVSHNIKNGDLFRDFW